VNNPLLALQNIRRTYQTGDEALTVLNGASLVLSPG